MLVTLLAAVATWLLPAGKYNTLSYEHGDTFTVTQPTGEVQLPFTQHTLDSLHIRIPLNKFSEGAIRKPVSVPGTYHQLPEKAQGPVDVLQAPLRGITDTIDIVLFLLVIGGFMNVFHETGAMVKGLAYLSRYMKGQEAWLIIILTFLFSFGGSSFGMAEEALVFYPIMVPLFLAAGYDLLVPVAVIFGGTQLGVLSSFTNPFSTIIASNAAGVNWTDGLNGRLLLFVLSTGLTIWYIVRYAKKVKRNPAASLVNVYDGKAAPLHDALAAEETTDLKLERSTRWLLLLFLSTFLVMIAGVVFLDWWLLEMSTLFLASALLLALLLRMNESVFIARFIKGAEDMLGVAFIIGVARGVTIMLDEGQISDTILYHSAQLVGHMPPTLFVVVLLLLFMVFTLFISSSSGMAVLTMPIMGALAVMVNVPGREIVNAYLFGMGIMGFVTPTGLLLPSLALVNVSFRAWWRFIYPLLLLLFILCSMFLIAGVQL